MRTPFYLFLRYKSSANRLIALLLLFVLPLQGASAHFRIATLDWTVAETLIALGEPPVAVGDVKSYRQWVAQPQLPADTLDLGLRMQPNPELLIPLSNADQKAPLIFINTGFYASTAPLLQRFAQQVHRVDFYAEGDAWQNILNASKQVADIINRPQAFEQLIRRYQQKLAEIRPHLQAFRDRPLALVQFIDSRHLRIYAPNSPFGAVLSQLGLQNAWSGSQNNWGFETIDLTQLAKLPQNSRLVVIKPYPANIETDLKYNTLWRHLTMARDPLILPAIWTFGGIPSAQRFAQALADGLQNGGEAW
ncbi:iron-siderophore ABC transporter substrate-binding protein [Actinobacillus sp. GY-402]|nr:iron-siderophore ABC transporter substrate-binding protein [Actinobacillus sp. GY-402]